MNQDIVYRIDAERSCDFADDQEWEPGDGPAGKVAVRPIHAYFDAGSQGCLVRCVPHYAAIPELVEAWTEAGLTGFRTESMISSPSPEAREYYPDYEPPAYVEVIFADQPGGDFYDRPTEVEVRVSRRAAAIYSGFDPGMGGLLVGTESDPMGESLPADVKARLLDF